MVYVEGCNEWTRIATYEVDLDFGNEKSCLNCWDSSRHTYLKTFLSPKLFLGFHIGMYSKLLLYMVSVSVEQAQFQQHLVLAWNVFNTF